MGKQSQEVTSSSIVSGDKKQNNSPSVSSSMAAIDLFENNGRSRATTFGKANERPSFMRASKNGGEEKKVLSKLSED